MIRGITRRLGRLAPWPLAAPLVVLLALGTGGVGVTVAVAESIGTGEIGPILTAPARGGPVA